MATLLRGNNGNGVPTPAESIEPEPQTSTAAETERKTEVVAPSVPRMTRDPLDPDEVATRRLYQASLLLADIMLLCLATWLVFIADKPLGFLSAAGIVLAVAVGAWLACLAIWMEQPGV